MKRVKSQRLQSLLRNNLHPVLTEGKQPRSPSLHFLTEKAASVSWRDVCVSRCCVWVKNVWPRDPKPTSSWRNSRQCGPTSSGVRRECFMFFHHQNSWIYVLFFSNDQGSVFLHNITVGVRFLFYALLFKILLLGSKRLVLFYIIVKYCVQLLKQGSLDIVYAPANVLF